MAPAGCAPVSWWATTDRCGSKAPGCTWTATGPPSARWRPICSPGRQTPVDGVDLDVLRNGLDALFGGDEDPDLQRLAAASAVLRGVSVIAGGPGTGKTTTVARVLLLLDEQASAAGRRPPLIALAAPTGKAAARLDEAVKEEGNRLTIPPQQRERLFELRGQTLHRLLGWSPNHTRFRHHRLNRLAHDIVIVDETSMVSLSLMASLVEAVRPDGRLILVGDPEQLASVEAGAVLGDLVGPATQGLRMRGSTQRTLAEVTGQKVPASEPPGDTPIGDGIVVLRQVHRFGGAIALLAEAIRKGDADATIQLLEEDRPDVCWLPVDIAATPDALGEVRTAAVAAARRVVEAGRAGEAREALTALSSFRVLCAHRRGPEGATTWMGNIEGWLKSEIEGFGAEGKWYVGRPLLVTANDYSLRLYNGDTGVVVVGSRASPHRGIRARRRDPRGQPVSPRRGRHRVRHDHPQGARLPIRHGRRPPSRPELAGSHEGTALHRRLPWPKPGDPRRHGGSDPDGSLQADFPILGSTPTAVGCGVGRRERGRPSRRPYQWQNHDSLFAILHERTERRDEPHFLDGSRATVEESLGADQVGEAPCTAHRNVQAIS